MTGILQALLHPHNSNARQVRSPHFTAEETEALNHFHAKNPMSITGLRPDSGLSGLLP